MRKAAYLFDIDGTLLSTGGAGRRAMARAFERCHGRRDACDTIPFGGMTDRAIVRRALAAIEKNADETLIDAVIAAYVAILAEEVTAAEGYTLHEGVLAALDAVAAAPGVAVGLGTGNVEHGARIKLERAGIAHRFAFGGFGSDHEDRAELLRIGAERGAARLGVPLSSVRVLVIGDTPRDIAAARAIGAECLAVATGSFGLEELREHEPTFLARNLGESAARNALFP